MLLKPTCEILRKTSKNNKEYFVLYFKDIDKEYFLEKTEVLLLKKLNLIKE